MQVNLYRISSIRLAHVFANIVNTDHETCANGAFGERHLPLVNMVSELIGSTGTIDHLFLYYVFTVYFIILGTISRICGFSILKIIRMIRESYLLYWDFLLQIWLPRMLKKLEIAGCESCGWSSHSDWLFI